MLDFLIPHLADIIIGAIVFVALGAVALKMLRDKKNNKSSCSGGCCGCPGTSKCGSHK